MCSCVVLFDLRSGRGLVYEYLVGRLIFCFRIEVVREGVEMVSAAMAIQVRKTLKP